jgi:hypothetical protein
MPGMNLGEIKRYIKRHMGFYEKKDADLVEEIIAAQRSLEAGVQLVSRVGEMPRVFKPWFLISEVQTALTIIDEDRVPLPAAVANKHEGFLSENEDAALWVVPPDAISTTPWTELIKEDFDYIQRTWAGPGIPKAYAALGGYFRLRHIPDQEYTLKIITHNADLTVTNDSGQNQWMKYAPLLLAAKAGQSMSMAVRDSQAVADFSRTRDLEAASLFTTTEARLHENKRIVMGGED